MNRRDAARLRPLPTFGARARGSRREARLVTTRARAFHGVSHLEELSAAQRAAVTSDARLVVVQGGPGAGKTEAAVARVARLTTSRRLETPRLLALVTGEAKARAFRLRLARTLVALGCTDASTARTLASVVATGGLGGAGGAGDTTPADSTASWPPEIADRIAVAAGQLAPHMGLRSHIAEATALLGEAMRFLTDGNGSASAAGDGDWFRRGVGLVEETVRYAQTETLRRLRVLEGTAGWIGDLSRQLRRPADVVRRARDLRSALDRAARSSASERAELGRLRSWLDVAAIDLKEAARREAVAAAARGRLWAAARALSLELGLPIHEVGPQRAEPGGNGSAQLRAARHVIIDDAHDLRHGELERLRRVAAGASLFVTGDQRAASGYGADARFRALLREAGRAVVLLEAPRFGAGVGRFVNALGSRLWPASEPGGYAPAIARLDADPSAAAPVELWLVRRRVRARAEREHPEPIAAARAREALAVAAGVRAMGPGSRPGETAVLLQDACGREVFAEALAAQGVAADSVEVRTVDECQGLEWSTVFVTGLDESLGGPAPRRAWLDGETGLAVVWPEDECGRRVWPFSSLLLAQRAATLRDGMARQRLFLAAARARTRLILTGVTRDGAAGGATCAAPIEWLRRQLGVADLAAAPAHARLSEADVGVRVVDGEQFLPT